MSDSQTLFISKEDFETISSLVANIDTETGILLEEELSRATIVDQNSLSTDVVTMGSVVRFIDMANDQEFTGELLYPHEMTKESPYQKLSILAPVGAALIGLSAGHTIDWPLPNGKTKHLKVTSVTRGT